jgi:hypothetical protein
MKRLILFITFCTINFFFIAQTVNQYKSDAKDYYNFYKTTLNIFMSENKNRIGIDSWDLNTININFSPEEGIKVLEEEEALNYSKNELDSLKIKNWYEYIYTISIEVNLLNGAKDSVYLFLSPDGSLQLKGDYYHLWNKNKP